MRKFTEERFWSRVHKTDTCWLWMGTITTGGYGRIQVNCKLICTHRLSWEMRYGKIPKGMFALHKCDVPNCVNPNHLYIGTTQDNMNDKVNRGRSPRGESHGNNRLKESQIRSIRKINSFDIFTQAEIGKIFSVARETTRDIINKKIWKHV